MSEKQKSNADRYRETAEEIRLAQSVPAPPRSGSSCSTPLIVTIVWPCTPNDGGRSRLIRTRIVEKASTWVPSRISGLSSSPLDLNP
jgi:hypothetical protein